MTKPTWN